MFGHAVGIFGLIVIKSGLGTQLGNRIGLILENHNRQLPAGNIFFRQQQNVIIMINDIFLNPPRQ